MVGEVLECNFREAYVREMLVKPQQTLLQSGMDFRTDCYEVDCGLVLREVCLLDWLREVEGFCLGQNFVLEFLIGGKELPFGFD